MQKIKRIPYGQGDFEAVNAKGKYYVDKTMFIPEFEKTNYVFLIRPRRFGKSLFLSMLHSYYDLTKADRFEEFYRDTWILKNPTEERAIYMVLTFNFSVIDSRRDKLEDSFNEYCNEQIDEFLDTYKEYLNEKIITNVKNKQYAYQKITALGRLLRGQDKKIYVMIDEYDNFANKILSEERITDYHELTHSSGIFRDFFAVLKDATDDSGSPVARLFITGVSPVTMDDVTSGFNIGNNISLMPQINEAFGFTQKDVEEIIDYYTSVGEFPIDKELALDVMEKWYDHYRFSEKVENTMYNTCSILYFMNKVAGYKDLPKNLIDDNLKMDYRKLKSLIIMDKKLNGNFSILNEILKNGGISSNVNLSFPYEELKDKENFVSLLYYLGLLTFDGIKEGFTYLSIPNESIKSMMYGYIRSSLKSVGDFSVDIFALSTSLQGMAYRGEFKPVFQFLADEISKQTKVRDYIQGEKVIQGFFLAYLNILDFYQSCSEEELNKGYADIVFKPFWQKYQDIKYCYLCEFKYISRIPKFDKLSKKKQKEILEPKINKVVAESKTQLAKYANDDSANKTMHTGSYGNVILKKIIVVFHAWDLVYLEEYQFND